MKTSEKRGSHNNILKENISLLASIAILLITVATILFLSIRKNQGQIVYALDDAYIHMAIAKNFALHGVWGITRYGFTSSSSSILYTLLLSVIYFIFGVNEITPFILNMIFATLSICVIFYFLKRNELNSFYIFIVLVSIIFFTPLTALIFSGMEHTLQLLITITFVYLSAKMLSKNTSTRSEDVSLLIMGILVTMVRFEGLFLLFIVTALFMLRKRWRFSLVLLIFGLLPIAIYGIISMYNGWFFLPNSILLKGNTPAFSLFGLVKFFYHFGEKMISTTHIFILVCAALILFIYQYDKQRTWKYTTFMLVIFIFTSIAQIMFAGVGWFYRYEAYLIALGIFVIALSTNEYFPKKILINKDLIPKYAAIVALIILAMQPFAGIGFKSLRDTLQAPHDRYLEHLMPAYFLREYYQGDTIVINDVGAISYYSDARILDMYGLGSIEPLKYRKADYDKEDVREWAKKEGATLAYVQIEWKEVQPRIPDQWIEIGQWEIPVNVVFGNTKFVWYVIDPAYESSMIKNLKDFSKKLPADINQSGKYMENN